jgi:hypothetical protein
MIVDDEDRRCHGRIVTHLTNEGLTDSRDLSRHQGMP